MEDSTGQIGITIAGVYIGADLLFDLFGLAVSIIDLAYNPTDPLAYAGVFLILLMCFSGDLIRERL